MFSLLHGHHLFDFLVEVDDALVGKIVNIIFRLLVDVFVVCAFFLRTVLEFDIKCFVGRLRLEISSGGLV